MKKIIRGAIYYADLDPIMDNEKKDIKPVLVIQNDLENEYKPTTIVISILDKKSDILPTDILVKQFDKIRPDSVIVVEQIRTIDKNRLKGFVDFLDDEQLVKVNDAILKLLLDNEL